MRLEGTLPNGVSFVVPDDPNVENPTQVIFTKGQTTLTLSWDSFSADTDVVDHLVDNLGGVAAHGLREMLATL